MSILHRTFRVLVAFLFTVVALIRPAAYAQAPTDSVQPPTGGDRLEQPAAAPTAATMPLQDVPVTEQSTAEGAVDLPQSTPEPAVNPPADPEGPLNLVEPVAGELLEPAPLVDSVDEEAPKAVPPPVNVDLGLNGLVRLKRDDTVDVKVVAEAVDERLKTVTIRMTLPASLELEREKSSGVEFDSATRELVWRDVSVPAKGRGNTTIGYTLRIASGNAPESVELKAVIEVKDLGYRGEQVYVLSIGQSRIHPALRQQEGAKVDVSSRIALEFSPNALPRDLDLETVVWPEMARKGQNTPSLDMSFGPDMVFAAPVTLTAKIGDLLTPDLWSMGLRPVLLHRPSGAKAQQPVEEVSSSYDLEQGVLTARLEHFSDYTLSFAIQAGKTDPWKMTPNQGSVSLFRGAVNYGMAIAAPSLPDGGAPQLSVNYSSAGADGGANDDNRIGTGWSLDVPNIHRGVKVNLNYSGPGDLNPTPEVDSTGTDFKLSLWGGAYSILPVNGETLGLQEYRTENYQPIRIFRCRVGTTCNGWAVTVPAWSEPNSVPYLAYYGGTSHYCQNTSNTIVPAVQHYWQVWTPDGTRYVFGTDQYSTKRFRKKVTPHGKS